MRQLISDIISFAIGGGAIGAAIIWIFNNPDKAEKIGSWFYGTFTWFHKKWEYNKIATDAQAKVNSYCEKITKESQGIFPHAMKIEWAKDSSAVEIMLDNDQIVVTLDYSKNQDRNIVVATLGYLGKGLLPQARPFIDETLMKSTDFKLAKNLFSSSGLMLASQYFYEKYFEPECRKLPLVRENCIKLDTIDEKGFFTRIFLTQMTVFGNKVYTSTPDARLKQETVEFKEFVYRIANKRQGVNVLGGLTFLGSKIRVAVILVAKQDTLKVGIIAFERRIMICRAQNVEQVYICGMGAENIQLAQEVADNEQRKKTLSVISSDEYRIRTEGHDLNATCILCQLTLPLSLRVLEDTLDIIKQILIEYVPEIENGQIQIKSIARRPGIVTKIAVFSDAQDINAVNVCKSKILAITQVVGGETVEFIEWSPDPEKFIFTCLAPLKKEELIECRIDTTNKEAYLITNTPEIAVQCLGVGNQKVELAKTLTGYKIGITSRKRNKSK